MTWFTGNPLERLMTQIPKAERDVTPRTPAPEGHYCYGCGRFGAVCARPCYREKKNLNKETKKHDLSLSDR